jgi:hypothetical protein
MPDNQLPSLAQLDALREAIVLASKPRLTLSMTLRRRISVHDFPPP